MRHGVQRFVRDRYATRGLAAEGTARSCGSDRPSLPVQGSDADAWSDRMKTGPVGASTLDGAVSG